MFLKKLIFNRVNLIKVNLSLSYLNLEIKYYFKKKYFFFSNNILNDFMIKMKKILIYLFFFSDFVFNTFATKDFSATFFEIFFAMSSGVVIKA
jgi:hypothetical protein